MFRPPHICLLEQTPIISATGSNMFRTFGEARTQVFNRESKSILLETLNQSGLDFTVDVSKVGEEGMGDRLFKIQEELSDKAVIYIGSKCPHLPVDILREAASLVESGDFVLGPATDGGVYLLGMPQGLTQEEWNSIPFSRPISAVAMKRIILKKGILHQMSDLTDIKQAEDFDFAWHESYSLAGVPPRSRELFQQFFTPND